MLKLEGVSTAKIVLFHQGSTELRRCDNCAFFLSVNILMGVARRLLGPHDTLPYVLIANYFKSEFFSSLLLTIKKKLMQSQSWLMAVCWVITKGVISTYIKNSLVMNKVQKSQGEKVVKSNVRETSSVAELSILDGFFVAELSSWWLKT